MEDFSNINDIPQFSDWKKIEQINRGWSDDEKYYIEDCKGEKLLLRLSDVKNYQAKKIEFNYISEVYSLGLNSSKPLDFGVCCNGEKVYTLFTWVDGEDAKMVLPNLDEKQQYLLGIKSGEMLKKIHSISAPEGVPDWGEKYSRKIETKIKKYQNCPIKIDDDEAILKFIDGNIDCLKGRPSTFQHGDYHIENFVINHKNEIGVIDFNRMDFGDPWEEFNRIVFSWRVSIPFANGQIHGYFNNDVPDEFFKLMALYIASNAITSIAWAIPFGQEEVDFMIGMVKETIKIYDGFKTYVPLVYKEPEYYIKG